MTPLTILLKRTANVVKSNSPVILTALGVSGTVTTAYLANRAGYRHARRIGEEAADLSPREEAELVWKLYIPTGVSGAFTIGCIIAASRAGSRRAAAITAAYSISEKAFSEYKDKVIEKFGETKEQQVRDDVAQDRVNKDPIQPIIVTTGGDVLCHEQYTGRFFKCDMESLRKAENKINAQMIREYQATLSDFYYLIGLPPTQYSTELGWNSDKLMSLYFSTVLDPDNRPCLSFEYNYVRPLD